MTAIDSPEVCEVNAAGMHGDIFFSLIAKGKLCSRLRRGVVQNLKKYWRD